MLLELEDGNEFWGNMPLSGWSRIRRLDHFKLAVF